MKRKKHLFISEMFVGNQLTLWSFWLFLLMTFQDKRRGCGIVSKYNITMKFTIHFCSVWKYFCICFFLQYRILQCSTVTPVSNKPVCFKAVFNIHLKFQKRGFIKLILTKNSFRNFDTSSFKKFAIKINGSTCEDHKSSYCLFSLLSFYYFT